MFRLNPEVLDQAREICGLTSDEKLGSHLNVSGTTVRNWRHGRAQPALENLIALRKLTGIPLESMVTETSHNSAA